MGLNLFCQSSNSKENIAENIYRANWCKQYERERKKGDSNMKGLGPKGDKNGFFATKERSKE